MTSGEVGTSLAVNLLTGVIIFLMGLFWPVIPKSYRKFVLRRFWGKAVLGEDFAICYGEVKDSRLVQANPPPFRYVKQYHDGRLISLVGPFNIVGEAEVRSAAYLINTLSTYRKRPVAVTGDVPAFQNLDRTFVALGSSSSNDITDLIVRESNNTFLEFGQVDNKSFIRDKRSSREFRGFEEPIKRDYGMVLKLPNLRFPGHFFFVCAGLGEWGTSGASWYLAAKWRRLHSEFGNAFGIVVEVEIGSDESARRVFPEENGKK